MSRRAVSGVRSALPYQQSPSRAARSIAFRTPPPIHHSTPSGGSGATWAPRIPHRSLSTESPRSRAWTTWSPSSRRAPLCSRFLPHGPELTGAAAKPGLDDERPRRHRGERPDLLSHQYRVPQGDEKQAAHGPVGPFRQDATKHRHVLDVTSRAGGVVVAQGQAVEAGPIGGLGLAQYLERPLPMAARTIRAERGANGNSDAHHPDVSLTSPCLPRRRTAASKPPQSSCISVLERFDHGSKVRPCLPLIDDGGQERFGSRTASGRNARSGWPDPWPGECPCGRVPARTSRGGRRRANSPT